MEQSKVRYGQEYGPNLIKIAKRLLENEDLVMLLNNTDLDPLNREKHPEKIDGYEIFNKLIRVVPILDADEENVKSKIVMLYEEGKVSPINPDNEELSFAIHVFCPYKEWQITGDTLRPYAIMAEIRKSIQDRRINGLGEIIYDSFSTATLTEEMGIFVMRFRINAFS